jgi:hypothetical protein
MRDVQLTKSGFPQPFRCFHCPVILKLNDRSKATEPAGPNVDLVVH